jgi:hypothetical protein
MPIFSYFINFSIFFPFVLSGLLDDMMADHVDWCCRWPYTPRNDGRPRLLIFSNKYTNGISSVIDRIKQVF